MIFFVKKDFLYFQLILFSRTVTCLDFLESGDVIGGDDSGAVRVYSVSIGKRNF